MDQTVLPALASFEIVVDGVPTTPTIVAWTDATTLNFSWAGVPAATAVWNQLTTDSNLRGLDQSLVKAPQTQDFFP
jgi:hypothetical protein